MQACFPSGGAFSMFNRNGFNYFGVDELTKVYRTLRQRTQGIQTVAVSRLVVGSDINGCASLSIAGCLP